jgi:hypothetical protein
MIEKSEVRLTLIDRLIEAHVRMLMGNPSPERLNELTHDASRTEGVLMTIADRLGLEPLPDWTEIRDMAEKVLENSRKRP